MMKNIVILNVKNTQIDYKLSSNINIIPIEFDLSEFNQNGFSEIPIYDFLKSNIESIKQSNGLIISSKCDWKVAIVSILYLRLNPEWSLDGFVIVWDSKKALSDVITFINTDFNCYFIPNKSTIFIDRRSLPSGTISERIEDCFLNSIIDEKFSIQIKDKESSSHQLTNEWGAYKLSHTAGLTYLLPLIEEQQTRSKTLYFQYLKRKNNILIDYSIQVPNNNSTPTIKYLLIDDNYNKGWELVFNAVFQEINPDLGIETYQNISKINENIEAATDEIIELIKEHNYQGILLDLRLTPNDDRPEKSNTKIIEFSGGIILGKLKEKFPFLPVIMVTASNKAWNMRQLLDAGADGYFIKEDPESNPNAEISNNTYSAFKQLIKDCQEKYKILQPFWKYIEQIEQNGTLINEKTENDVPVTNVEGRIKERLKMFFGLLKRSFEDTQYNERFHYSDKSLAFMTLWSCLNDIQYIYYDKSSTRTNTTGRIFNEIKIESTNINQLRVNGDYLQKFNDINPKKYGFEVNLEANYSNVLSVYQVLSSPIIGKDYSGNIGEQIAFLILKFGNSSYIIDETLGAINAEKLADNLAKLKNKRNNLYLTHGEETINFFKSLEKDNVQIEIQDCKELFEIVYFLLKGTYVQV